MKKDKNLIKSITIKGFKSICSEQKVEFRPLTILAGANSSGKSSIMQPLLLLKQTIEAPSDPGALLLDGDNVRFTSAEQIMSKIQGITCSKNFSFGIELDNNSKITIIFDKEPGIGFDIHSISYSDPQENIQIKRDLNHEEIRTILSPKISDNYVKMFKKENGDLRWEVVRNRCFLSFQLKNIKSDIPISFGPYGISPGVVIIPHLQNLIHLPGLRGNPKRTYPKTSGGPLFPGTFENYVASIITGWQSENDNGSLKELGKALEHMGLTWKVRVEPFDDTKVEIRVGRLQHSIKSGARDLVSIADVGFGVSQSLPVLVSLIVAKAGQIVYIEQPEIHLHPKAQRRLANVICDAAKRGVMVIIETHSSILIKEIQTLVVTGYISKNDIILQWVQRDKSGSTQIIPSDLDENGAYGKWPIDFDDVERDVLRSYLDSVESKIFKK